MNPEIEAVRELEDPLKQAQHASELLTRYQAAVTQLSHIRRDAIEQLIAQGNLNRDNLVVICGPRLSPIIAQVLASDPNLGFAHDDQG